MCIRDRRAVKFLIAAFVDSLHQRRGVVDEIIQMAAVGDDLADEVLEYRRISQISHIIPCLLYTSNPHSQPRQQRRTEGGRLKDSRAADRSAEQIGLELHQKRIPCGAAVSVEPLHPDVYKRQPLSRNTVPV